MRTLFLILAVTFQSAMLTDAAYGALPIGPKSLALSTTAETEQARSGLDRYRSYTDTLIAARCRKNTGTALDKNLAAAYESTCRASYVGAREEANKYFEKEGAAEAQVKALTAQSANMCGANRSASGQKACLDKVADAYEQASKIKDQLSSDLLGAYNKAMKWRNQNAEALRKYRTDKKNLQVAYDNAMRTVSAYRQSGQIDKANQVVKELETSAKVSTGQAVVDSTIAQSVTQSTISGYKQNIDSLMQEQAEAENAASQFSEDAKNKAYQLKEESERFAEMAREIRARAAALPTADTSSSSEKSGLSDSRFPDGKDAPIPRPRPPDSEIAAAKPAETSTQRVADTNTTQTKESVTPVENNSTSGSRNQTPESGIAQAAPAPSPGSSPAPSPVASPAPMAAAPAMLPSSTGSLSPGYDPYSYGGVPMAGATPNSEAGSVPLAGLPVAKLGEVQPETVAVEEEFPKGEAQSDNPRFADIPNEMAAGQGISGDIKSSSAASTSAGVRGENGGVGFSSASGGRLGGSERAQKEIAAKEQFVPKLESGAVSIAGSDVKSAVAALAEEFGAVDIDLDLGGLTDEEKAALSPLEGGGSSGNVRASSAGERRTASASSDIDRSIQDVESLGLFERTHSAHERAQKRGNLILGLKKKF